MTKKPVKPAVETPVAIEPSVRMHDFFVELMPFLRLLTDRTKQKTCLVCGETNNLVDNPIAEYPEFVFCQRHNSQLLLSAPVTKKLDTSILMEPFAEFMHDAWSQWTLHYLDHLTTENILRWREQAKMFYDLLSEEDKEKDRVFARELIALMESTL